MITTSSTWGMARCVAGVVIAPGSLPIAFALGEFFSPQGAGGTAVASVIALFTYATTLSLGVPLHLLMRRRRYSSATQYTIGGALLGAFAGAILAPAFLSFSAGSILGTSALGFFVGAVSATVFWFIAVWSPRDASSAAA
jgi:hypothetical protein